ncbi:site-2 protease family protein [Candidatus Microgenomates bacterium]|nr:site-2 protease family protein [Candidatus Microgenomates bacterium]
MITAIVFIAVLSLLVFVHELGHFLVAKKLGIRVDEFGFGIPPRIFGKKVGETIYSLNLLPIGGFVKLFGEDEESHFTTGSHKENLKRAFFSRPKWQRTVVLLAGVAMNFLLAISAFYTFLFVSNFKTDLPLVTKYRFFLANQADYNVDKPELVVSYVSPGSPAENTGMKAPFKILSITGQKVEDQTSFKNIVDKYRGKEFAIEWQELKTGRSVTGKIIPRITPPKNEGALGVAFFPMAIISFDTLPQKLFSGITYSINFLFYTLKILGDLIALSFEERTVGPVGESVSGPLGIASIIGAVLQIPDIKEKITQMLNLVGMLSISLAFFNVLPIPALDGGRLLFIGIEAVIGKRVKPKVEAITHQVGFLLLIILLILISYNDLLRNNLIEKFKNLFP